MSGGQTSPNVQKPLNIGIIAMKRLSSNTRIARQAQALSQAGHDVTVIALDNPLPELRAQAPAIEWITTSHVAPARFLHQFMERQTKSYQALYLSTAQSQPEDTALYKKIILYLIFFLPTLLCYGLYRLQIPRGFKTGLELKDVLQLNSRKVFIHLMMPYTEVRAAIFAHNVMRILKHKNAKFDVIIAHDNYVLHTAEKIKKKWPDVKIVFDAVEVFGDIGSSWIRSKPLTLQRRAYANDVARMKKIPDRIITFGEGAARWFEARYELKRPDIIFNCRDYMPPPEDQRLRRDCGLENNPEIKIIVCMNTFYPGQGLEDLMHAMAQLPDHIHMATVGWDTSGSYMADCLKIAEEKGFAHRIHYLPRRTTIDLVPYASGADICIIPRTHNHSINGFFSMPNRIFEAMMARLPMASTDLIDHKHMIEYDYEIGKCFPQNDPDNMARTILWMLEPQNMKRLKQNLENAVRILCWQNEGKSFVKIIEAAANGTDDPQQFFFDSFPVDIKTVPENHGGQKKCRREYPTNIVQHIKANLKTYLFTRLELD